MKVIFAGTPEFAAPALAALIGSKHDIVMVLTQPDRPAGRGMHLKASPVKQMALQHGLNVYQPETLKTPEVQAHISVALADVMIVAAYGLIIPTVVLNMFKLGCYNIHASLLPRWRGAAPIHRALLTGDKETGVTIMEVVSALDAGAMVSKGVVPIRDTDTTQTLHDQLSKIGADLMVQAMDELAKNGTLTFVPQDESLVTYAHKLVKSESAINWSKSTVEISRQVRAFNPFPVATAQFRGETCRIWFASALNDKTNVKNGEIVSLNDKTNVKNGEIVSLGANIHAACGQGILEIHELQMPGGKRQTASQFIQGQHVKLGELFS